MFLPLFVGLWLPVAATANVEDVPIGRTSVSPAGLVESCSRVATVQPSRVRSDVGAIALNQKAPLIPRG